MSNEEPIDKPRIKPHRNETPTFSKKIDLRDSLKTRSKIRPQTTTRFGLIGLMEPSLELDKSGINTTFNEEIKKVGDYFLAENKKEDVVVQDDESKEAAVKKLREVIREKKKIEREEKEAPVPDAPWF